MTDQQDKILAEVIAKRNQKNEPVVEQPEGSFLGNLTRTTLGQGLLLGFGDELEAGFRAAASKLTNDPQTYKEIRDGVREQIKQFQARNPGTAITSEIVGL